MYIYNVSLNTFIINCMETAEKYPDLRKGGGYVHKGISKFQNLQSLITTYAQTMPDIPYRHNVLCQVVKNSLNSIQ